MAGVCGICKKDPVERRYIDDAIRARDSFRAIARRHGVSHNVISRHAKHVIMETAAVTKKIPMDKIAAVGPAVVEDPHKYNFVADLLALKGRAMKLLEIAEKKSELALAVQIMREIRSQIETVIKVALAQRELEQKDVDVTEDVKVLSKELMAIIDNGLDFDPAVAGAEVAEFEVMEDEDD